MFLIELAKRRMRAAKLRARSTLRELLRRWRHNAVEDHLEHNLGRSSDRFELERRERAWGRRHYSEASLLGE